MPKGYVFAEVEVTDPVLYAEYRTKVPGTIAAYGGRFLVRGGDPVRLEGDRPMHRFVVLGFDSPERASDWYCSEEYGPVKALRLKSATTHAFLLNGAEAQSTNGGNHVVYLCGCAGDQGWRRRRGVSA